MGIRNLNRFLKENCSKKSIRKVQLSQLSHKTVVIDASIYMYRYVSENALMENMYLLVALLLANDIIPLFVFDGKPPPEKRELLKIRRAEKKKAEHKYAELMDEYNKEDISVTDKQTLLTELNVLKQQFVRVTDNDIQNVKKLLTAYGVMYYDSQNEADEVCAYMVKSGKAWACMSDDMDMFVYGCTRVLRGISLLNKTVILYETPLILEELCMTEDIFRQLMVVSGTDYNTQTSADLDTTIQLYSKYVQNMTSSSSRTNELTFYQWLPDNSNYVIDMSELLHICDLFTIKQIYEPSLDEMTIALGKRDDNMIHTIMSTAGFVFT